MQAKPPASLAPIEVGQEVRPLQALLRAEWLAHRTLLSGAFSIWFVGIWVLPACIHPGILFAFGILYALLVPGQVAGADVADGSEEFRLSLPLSRSDYYLTRLALSGLPLLVFQGIGVVALFFELPQLLWSLFVESGLNQTPDLVKPLASFYALVTPLAVFSFAFALAANFRNPKDVGSSPVLAIMLIGMTAFLGRLLQARLFFFSGWSGVTLVLLSLSVPLSLTVGYRAFCEKECSGDAVVGRTKAIFWVIALLLLFFVFLTMALS